PQLLDLARGDLLVQVLEGNPRDTLALELVPLRAHRRDLTRLALVGHNQERIPGLRHAREPEQLDGIRWARTRDLLAPIVEHGPYPPGMRPHHDGIAFPERARLNEGRRHG